MTCPCQALSIHSKNLIPWKNEESLFTQYYSACFYHHQVWWGKAKKWVKTERVLPVSFTWIRNSSMKPYDPLRLTCIYQLVILLENKNVPSLSVPSSAAWPLGKIVFTKIPMFPFGESLPPTMENPSPFLPWPFSKTTVWKERLRDFGLRGSVDVDDGLCDLWDTCWEIWFFK